MLLLKPDLITFPLATSDSSKIFPELSLPHIEQTRFSWPLLTGQMLQSPWWPLFLSPSCISMPLLYWAAPSVLLSVLFSALLSNSVVVLKCRF